MSLELVFSGLRVGDSTLLLYGLYEEIKLETLAEKEPEVSVTDEPEAVKKANVEEEMDMPSFTSTSTSKGGGGGSLKQKNTDGMPNKDGTGGTAIDETHKCTVLDDSISDRKMHKIRKKEEEHDSTTDIAPSLELSMMVVAEETEGVTTVSYFGNEAASPLSEGNILYRKEEDLYAPTPNHDDVGHNMFSHVTPFTLHGHPPKPATSDHNQPVNLTVCE